VVAYENENVVSLRSFPNISQELNSVLFKGSHIITNLEFDYQGNHM
jgi:predicted ester cyclase